MAGGRPAWIYRVRESLLKEGCTIRAYDPACHEALERSHFRVKGKRELARASLRAAVTRSLPAPGNDDERLTLPCGAWLPGHCPDEASEEHDPNV